MRNRDRVVGYNTDIKELSDAGLGGTFVLEKFENSRKKIFKFAFRTLLRGGLNQHFVFHRPILYYFFCKIISVPKLFLNR